MFAQFQVRDVKTQQLSKDQRQQKMATFILKSFNIPFVFLIAYFLNNDLHN